MAIMTGVQSPQILGKGQKMSASTDDDNVPMGRLNTRGNSKMANSIIDVIR